MDMKKKLQIVAIALMASVLLLYSCEKSFFHDNFGKEQVKTTSAKINYKSILQFEILRSFSYNQLKLDSISDTIIVQNISGDNFNSLDFLIDFYNGELQKSDELIMSFRSQNGINTINAGDKIEYILINDALVFIDEKKIDINVLRTGRHSDYSGGGVYDCSFVYYKVDTLNIPIEDYDTIYLGSGLARAIVDFKGQLSFKPQSNDYIISLSGLINPDGLFIGELISESSDTISIYQPEVSLPLLEPETTTNVFSFKQVDSESTVHQFRVHFSKD